MFKRLFGIARHPNQAIVDALYEQIVAAARQPHFYDRWGVPDTPTGRFEMLSLHMFLFLHRVREGSPALGAIAQEATDTFFGDMDHSLRELGIGDMGVPRRMKKLARMFYGRAQSYGAALDADDRPALAAAISRNVAPDDPDWKGGGELAGYASASYEALRLQDEVAILEGRLVFRPAMA